MEKEDQIFLTSECRRASSRGFAVNIPRMSKDSLALDPEGVALPSVVENYRQGEKFKNKKSREKVS